MRDIQAFPRIKKIFPSDRRDPITYDGTEGMTLRDYFAAKAMQGIISHNSDEETTCVAEWAYKHADAMLVARELNK